MVFGLSVLLGCANLLTNAQPNERRKGAASGCYLHATYMRWSKRALRRVKERPII